METSVATSKGKLGIEPQHGDFFIVKTQNFFCTLRADERMRNTLRILS